MAKSRKDTKATVLCLQAHGFLVNLQKSSLQPTWKLKHLGVVVDTSYNSLFLIEAKMQKMKEMSQAIKERSSTLMTLAKLTGLFV